MSLNDQIQEQYNNRLNKEGLYNSVYSRSADKEKCNKAKQLLELFLPGIENKLVLEVGAGQGGNVPLLRNCGFKDENIFLNEILPERLLTAKANYPTLKIYPGNAIEVDFVETYNCVFQSTVFTSVLNDTDRKKLADKMWRLLKPGGIILWYDFIYNNPNNNQVKKVTVKELKQLFPYHTEMVIKKVTLAPPIGRRVGSMYNLFNLPLLRSHILAVLKK